MRERITILAVLVAVVLVGSACSAGDTPGGGGGTADQTITIKDLAFDPTELTVSGSTTIEIVNQDTVEHSFTLDDDSVGQDVEGGESATVTIDPAASIGWHCEYHPDTMKGTITVS
ncbi:MAG: cupredoxin domain-containing protein [Actinobacteria bacterium]|nr:cupredoxin domain-containing protein [Actinomycetota bacterium]